jgi:excisionase family DNA binding protein
MSEPPRFLTVKQVAAALQVDPSMIYRMIQRNEIPHIKLNGYLRRIPAQWLDEQMERALHASEPEVVRLDRIKTRKSG